MRMLIRGLTVSLGLIAGSAQAEIKVSVQGNDLPLAKLMENCQSLSSAPEAQIACFNALSKLLEDQPEPEEETGPSVAEAFETFLSVAQYQDNDTGLSIAANECTIRLVYFNNYFHLSRRNISSIDLYSAQFDASKLRLDQTADVRGSKAPLVKGVMADGAMATTMGGLGLDSQEHGFTSKSARSSVGAYANEVAAQLPAVQDQTFQFVLVHPYRDQAASEIWTAFEDFVATCQK